MQTRTRCTLIAGAIFAVVRYEAVPGWDLARLMMNNQDLIAFLPVWSARIKDRRSSVRFIEASPLSMLPPISSVYLQRSPYRQYVAGSGHRPRHHSRRFALQ